MSNYAYVVTYYGGNASLIEALVLGKSLVDSGTSNDLVMLCRRGVSEESVKLLGQYFRVIFIDPFPVDGTEFSDDALKRFYGVFDKLYSWALTEYKKVVLLDADMLILQNCDKLFEFTGPAGCFFSPELAWRDNSLIGEEKLRSNIEYSSSTGLNLGVVVLEPSETSFAQLEHSLREMVGSGKQFEYPEQEFLAEHFIKEWHTIPVSYNWRPFNEAWRSNGKIWGRMTGDVRDEELYIIHYNWIFKPLQCLIHTEKTREVITTSINTPLTIGLFNRLESEESLKRFGQSSVRLEGMFGEWFHTYRRVCAELSTELIEQFAPEPFYSDEEHVKFIKQAQSPREAQMSRGLKCSRGFRVGGRGGETRFRAPGVTRMIIKS